MIATKGTPVPGTPYGSTAKERIENARHRFAVLSSFLARLDAQVQKRVDGGGNDVALDHVLRENTDFVFPPGVTFDAHQEFHLAWLVGDAAVRLAAAVLYGRLKLADATPPAPPPESGADPAPKRWEFAVRLVLFDP